MADVLDALDYESFGEVRYVVGSNVSYSVHVEYGTSRMQAQPYLRPAVERAVRELDTIADGADSPQEIAEALALKVEAEAKREVPVDTGNLKASISAQRLS
jgi:hypothetical protein